MAARSHVDSGVNERRLRPIYDCLDNGNNRKALQEAEKVLKKQKDFQCAKALKALALLRLGKHEDSTRLLQEIHSEVPTDNATLQAMTICYRELHRLDMIAEVYDAAVQKDPQNEELLTHLFMAYVRLSEYKKQQQVAIALYKLKAKNPYYFWGVMSVVMQAHDATTEVAQKMLLPLAERMIEKFVSEGKIEAEAEVQLYLLILELEHKYEAALKVLDGPLGEKLTSFLNFKATKRAELLRKLDRWPEVNAQYKELLSKEPDNWSFYSEYFTSVMKLVGSKYDPNQEGEREDSIDYTMLMAKNFIEDLVQEESKNSKARRGPFLAHIKLTCLSISNSDTIGSQELLVRLLVDYFIRFGSKPCFYNDIVNFLSFVDDNEKTGFLDSIKSIVNLENTDTGVKFAEDKKQMQQHLSYVQLCHYFGTHDRLVISDKLLFVEELLLRYNQGSAFGDDLLSTDLKPNDGYSILVGHILIDVWRESGDNRFLGEILVILEEALLLSPSNYQIKLLLIKLYNGIGAVGPSYVLYESMGIKHIQQDVLGYLVTPHLAAKGHFTEACIVYGNMLKFFTANYKDIVDYLIASYKYGSFTKIQEFVDFRERLNSSLQYATVAAERMIQDLIMETNNHEATEQMIAYMEVDPEKDKTAWDELRANWDLDLMVSWDSPLKQVTRATKQLAFDAEVEWLKVRNLLIRSLAAAHLLTTSSIQSGNRHLDNCCNIANGEKKLPQDILSGLVKQMQETTKKLKPEDYALPLEPIQGPSTSRLVSHLQGGYSNPIIELFNLVLRLLQINELANSEKSDFIVKMTASREIKECISRTTANLNVANLSDLSKMGSILEDLVNSAEMLSFAAILLGFCHHILRPAKIGRAKKGRKKEATQGEMPATVEAFNQLVMDVENVTILLYHSVKDFQAQMIISWFGRMNMDTNSDKRESLTQEITKKIEKSYQRSLTEIGVLLQGKLKYLSPLRF